MTSEIDKDFYCSAGRCRQPACDCTTMVCVSKHRKHPTPEQFKEEYGVEYPDDGAVWYTSKGVMDDEWHLGIYRFMKSSNLIYVCACTPWGKPPDDWRVK